MVLERERNRDEVLRRVTISLGLIVLALVLWLVFCNGRIDLSTAWLSGITTELVVLALAGIWVSYFVEVRAAEAMRRDIDGRFAMLSAALRAGIEAIFYHEDPNQSIREVSAYGKALISELERGRGEVRILAVAAREFLLEGQGFAYGTMERLVRARPVRLLLLHPWSEQAVSRALHEDREHSTFARYRESRLFEDVMRSCETWTTSMASRGRRVEARLYKVFPACLLVFVNDLVFVEQYHFGTGGRASGKVPLFQVHKGSRFYEQLEGHFEHVWKTAEPFRLTTELVERVRNPDPPELEQFEACIRSSRPDLFAAGMAG